MKCSNGCRATVFQLSLGLRPDCIPWQQRAEVVGGGGIRAERWRGDKGCCLGPVLTPVMGTICTQAGRYRLSVHHSTYRSRQAGVRRKAKNSHSADSGWVSCLTLFPSKRNDVSRALAHHLRNIEGAVGLISYGDGAIDCFCLHLQVKTDIRTWVTHRLQILNLVEEQHRTSYLLWTAQHMAFRASDPQL